MEERLEPTVIKTKTKISDLVGINIPNTIAILNGKGEIALLRFDENMKATEEVISAGFPGHWGQLESDPEQRFVWLRRRSGTYFADTETKETGHCVTMFPGSKVYQVVLINPEKRRWYIIYGQMGASLITEYSLDTDEGIVKEYGIVGDLWSFSDNRILSNTEYSGKGRDWRITTEENVFYPPDPELYGLTQKMTNMDRLYISFRVKPYSLISRTMIGSAPINGETFSLSIRWNEQLEAEILPFTPLHIPSDIQGVGGVGEFSSDGRWFDIDAWYKSHRFGYTDRPGERFVYHVGDQYPIGISPPIRLGLVSENTPGAFMQHDTWGPCYILKDEEKPQHVIVYKLTDGIPIIARKLAEYVPN